LKEIWLIDTSTWKGHHEISFTAILEILTRNQFYVYAYSPDNKALKKFISDHKITNCRVVDLKISVFRKMIFRLFTLLDRLWKMYSGYSVFMSLIPLLKVKMLSNDVGKKTLPVFFPHLDTILPTAGLWLGKPFMHFSWTGLYILPAFKSDAFFDNVQQNIRKGKEKYFASKFCRSFLVLNESYKAHFKNKLKNKPVYHLPELLNKELNKNTSIDKIQIQAEGRKIISIVGSLVRKKNFITFLESVSLLSNAEYFVLICGYLPLNDYTADEMVRIQELLKRIEKFSFQKFTYIKSEALYNSLYAISDLIFLHHPHHPFSSNSLIKAMAFKKPVIVAPGYYMEEVIKKYNWQAVVENHPVKIAETMKRLISGFEYNISDYQQLLKDYSPQRFERTILRSVKDCFAS